MRPQTAHSNGAFTSDSEVLETQLQDDSERVDGEGGKEESQEYKHLLDALEKRLKKYIDMRFDQLVRQVEDKLEELRQDVHLLLKKSKQD